MLEPKYHYQINQIKSKNHDNFLASAKLVVTIEESSRLINLDYCSRDKKSEDDEVENEEVTIFMEQTDISRIRLFIEYSCS